MQELRNILELQKQKGVLSTDNCRLLKLRRASKVIVKVTKLKINKDKILKL